MRRRRFLEAALGGCAALLLPGRAAKPELTLEVVNEAVKRTVGKDTLNGIFKRVYAEQLTRELGGVYSMSERLIERTVHAGRTETTR